MINADSYYEIGAGHTFCDDYADSGVINTGDNLYHYALVCDGCSGSKGSDIGARLLAKRFPHAFKVAIEAHKETGVELNKILEPCLVGVLSSAREALEIPWIACDATLVVTVYDQLNDTLHSFIWGDGKIFYKYKAENGYLIDVTYVKNAPFYLSYRGQENSEARYESQYGQMYGDVCQYLVKPDNIIFLPETAKRQQKAFYEKYPEASKTLAFASVFTDGIDTYHKVGDVNTLMPRFNVFNQLTQYKNLHGDFVKRRMQMVKKFCQKEGWQHFDDVSVATIVL